jgi:hypothetical protein
VVGKVAALDHKLRARGGVGRRPAMRAMGAKHRGLADRGARAWQIPVSVFLSFFLPQATAKTVWFAPTRRLRRG